jgi:hypothetical protein
MNPARRHCLWFAAALVVFSVRNYWELHVRVYPAANSAYLDGAVLGLIASCWMATDSRKRDERWPQDQMMLFYWFLFPAYLIFTRKWRGLGILALFSLGLALSTVIPLLLL